MTSDLRWTSSKQILSHHTLSPASHTIFLLQRRMLVGWRSQQNLKLSQHFASAGPTQTSLLSTDPHTNTHCNVFRFASFNHHCCCSTLNELCGRQQQHQQSTRKNHKTFLLFLSSFKSGMQFPPISCISSF